MTSSCSISSVTSCNNHPNVNNNDENQENETESGSNSLDDLEDRSESNSNTETVVKFDSKKAHPLAIFTCKPNSHPFNERYISVLEPVKIGRTFGKCLKPAFDNAIFDSKVLSRNHALLWYLNSKVRFILILMLIIVFNFCFF